MTAFARLSALLLALFVASACSSGSNGSTDPGGGGGGGGGVPTPGTLAVALGPTSGTTAVGGQLTAAVTITRGGSFGGTVTLTAEGAPAGVTASVSPSSLAAGATGATLTLATTSAAAPGSYTITVRATGTGVSAATATYTLTVTAPPDFSLSAAPATVTVTAGASATTTVAIARTGGFAGAVTFAASGLPAGVTVTFDPTAPTGNSTVATITAAASAAPGNYTVTLTGTGGGVGARTVSLPVTVQAATPTGDFAIGLPPGRTLRRTEQTIVGVSVSRSGGFTGDVALSISGLPNDVSASFSPATVPGSSTLADLTLSIGPSAPLGQVTVTVTGSAAGLGTRSSTFLLTVLEAPSVGVTLTANQTTITQGQSGAAITVSIARSGAQGNATMSVEGLPAGVTAAFTPNPVPTNQTSLVLTVGGSVAPGTYPLTVVAIVGSVRGEATLSLVVQAGGGGGGGNIQWRFCNTADLPLFFAYQDGTAGAWTRVTPDGANSYNFSLTQDVGGVAIVRPQDGGVAEAIVYYYRRDELAPLAASECVTNPAGKSLSGTVAGLAAGVNADVALGFVRAAVNGPGTNYTMTGVPDGPQDLIAMRAVLNVGTLSNVPNAVILRRDVNYAAGSQIPLLDFGGSEAFAPATATYTFGNTRGETFFATTQFVSSNGTGGSFVYGPLGGNATTTRTVYGIPSNRLRNGDFHQVFATTISNTNDIRIVFQFNRELADRTISFGPSLSVPTVSTIGTTPYARLRTTGTWQADYGLSVGVLYSQSAGGGRSWSVSGSRGYLAGGTFTLDIPDLSGVSGWNNTWGLVAGVQTDWTLSGTGATIGQAGVPGEGNRYEVATRRGTITP